MGGLIVSTLTPDTWYSDDDLQSRTGIDALAFREAAQRGFIKSVDTSGGPYGYRFNGAAVNEWLAGAPSGDSARTESGRAHHATAATEGSPPMAATFTELKNALPHANAEFREQCIEAGLSVAQAKAKWLDKREADIAARERLVDSQSSRPSRPGVEPAPTGYSSSPYDGSGDARSQWNAAIERHVAAGLTRAQAVSKVAHDQPELRERMLEEHNARFGRSVN